MGRSYAHVVLPVPHLDSDHRERFGRALEAEGWEPAADDSAELELGGPVLIHRWRHPAAGSLMLVVLAWYPLVFTLGPEDRPSARSRRAVRRFVETAVEAGGRELPDGDLDRVVTACRERWQQALEARRTIDEQRKWLECRHCEACGVWSAYGVLHCRGCSRRFAPADDAARNERGQQAADVSDNAERTLRSLGRGEGLFTAWPPPEESTQPLEVSP